MSQAGDVNDPLSPDYVEDYDFFDVKRKARLAAIQEEKLQSDVKHRQEIKRKALHWLENGAKAMKNLNIGLSGVRALLEPHHNTKLNVSHFNERMEMLEHRTRGVRCCRHNFPLANRVLYVTRADPLKHRKWFHNKANLIMWKFCVMKEIRAAFKDTRPFQFECRQTVPEIKILRKMFRVQMNNVPIERSISEELKRKRAHYKVVLAKLKLIHDTQAACQNILNCKSRQHTNPKGCSSCGVVYMGGMLGGGTQYVQSISRETGLSSLVTLEYEIEQLKQEDVVQIDIVEHVQMDLQAYESVVLGFVRINIQAWWSFVLVWKRYKRKDKRTKKSFFLHKRRRLVNMKRQIDTLIKEPVPLDMPYLCDAYCDIVPELTEYATLQTELKRERLLKWSRNFRRNLAGLVEVAREKKHQEYLRLLALPKPPRPIVFKTLPMVTSENEALICYRLECKMRKFLTKERFDIHMNVHYKVDKVRYQRYEANRAAKGVRDARSAQVLHRIKLSRHHLLQHSDQLEGSLGTREGPHAGGGGDDGDGRDDDASSVGDNSVGGDSVHSSSLAHNGHERGEQGNISPSLLLIGNSTTTDGSIRESGVHTTDSVGDSQGDHHSTTSSSTTRRTGFAKRKELIFCPESSIDADSALHSVSSKSQPHHGYGSTHSAVLPGRLGTKMRNGLVASLSSQDSDMVNESAQDVHNWAAMTHIYSLHSLHNDSMYSLELVSKHGDINVAQRVPLDRPLIRVGTHSSCESIITTAGIAKKEGRVAKVHCLFFCPTHSGSTEQSDPRKSNDSGSASRDQLTLVDNSSVWGTYVVSAMGTRKAPVKVTAGLVLTPGLLVCIGVCKDGPSEISATEANQACVVYRVRCLERENV